MIHWYIIFKKVRKIHKMNKRISIILPYYNRRPLLLKTLSTFDIFYAQKNLEIIIVDDCSIKYHNIDDIPELFPALNIKVITLNKKTGINPCLPYNIGVKNSTGEIIILSSPETLHVRNIFSVSNNFEELNYKSYLLFSVFCLTDKTLINNINTFSAKQIIHTIHNNEKHFIEKLGEYGYPFNNSYGSWYLHPEYRRSGLNFLTAITRDAYYDMSGFDERFRFGTGYDDTEFKDRLENAGINFKYYYDLIGIHVDHEIVNNSLPTTNLAIYENSKIHPYMRNNLWGIL